MLGAILGACSDSPTAATSPPEFSFVMGTPFPDPATAGDSSTVFLQSAFRNGFSQRVQFALEGPPGFSASFDRCPQITTQQPFGPGPGVICDVIVRIDRTVVPGRYLLVFTATANGFAVKRQTVPLGVSTRVPMGLAPRVTHLLHSPGDP